MGGVTMLRRVVEHSAGYQGVEEVVLSLGYQPEVFLKASSPTGRSPGPCATRSRTQAARHRGRSPSPPATPGSTARSWPSTRDNPHRPRRRRWAFHRSTGGAATIALTGGGPVPVRASSRFRGRRAPRPSSKPEPGTAPTPTGSTPAPTCSEVLDLVPDGARCDRARGLPRPAQEASLRAPRRRPAGSTPGRPEPPPGPPGHARRPAARSNPVWDSAASMPERCSGRWSAPAPPSPSGYVVDSVVMAGARISPGRASPIHHRGPRRDRRRCELSELSVVGFDQDIVPAGTRSRGYFRPPPVAGVSTSPDRLAHRTAALRSDRTVQRRATSKGTHGGTGDGRGRFHRLEPGVGSWPRVRRGRRRQPVERQAHELRADAQPRDHEFTFHQMDICDRRSELIERRFEVVFHLGAQIDVRVPVADPALDARINVLGTINVLEGASRCPQVVVLRLVGGTIYGDVDPTTCPSRAYLATPVAPYGVSKKVATDHLHAYRGAAPARAHPPGAGQRLRAARTPQQRAGVVAIFAGEVCWPESRATVFGDGAQTRDATCSSTTWSTPSSGREWAEQRCNIGTGVESSVLDLLCDHGGQRGDRTCHPRPGAQGELARSQPRRHRAENLGWRPFTDLSAAPPPPWTGSGRGLRSRRRRL